MACTIWVEADRLSWTVPLGRVQHASTDDVRRIRPMRVPSGLQVIELEGHRPLVVSPNAGFRDLADVLAALRPGLVVHLGWTARAHDALGVLPGLWRTSRPPRRRP